MLLIFSLFFLVFPLPFEQKNIGEARQAVCLSVLLDNGGAYYAHMEVVVNLFRVNSTILSFTFWFSRSLISKILV